MDKNIKIGLIGLGTVGSGVFKTLTSFDNIEVKAIAVRNINKKRDNKVILYEAAIAGGIPIIMPIKTILAGNKINRIEAIVNGTTNYILTKMDVQGASYESVLKEAQELGYAEADPTGDVEGFDAAYKIATLASITFQQRIKIENVYREGITKIRAQDMHAANDLGYKIKLIASAYLDENGLADVRVHPMLVSKKSSSVVGDILAIAAEIGKSDYILPMMRCKHSQNAQMKDISQTINKYYISINAKNNKGVIGKIGTICANHDISLASIVQRCVSEDNTADITVFQHHQNQKFVACWNLMHEKF